MSEPYEETWCNQLRNIISSKIAEGYTSTEDILPFCEGAQPKDVKKYFDELIKTSIKLKSADTSVANTFFYSIPAPNPLSYQWWFTREAQEGLAKKVLNNCPDAKIMCIGTPTIAASLKARNASVYLLDIDADIIANFKRVFNDPDDQICSIYDVWDDIDPKHSKKYDVIIIDPPWYKDYFSVFISRGIQCLKTSGEILCSIPQILTRPNISEEREALFKAIIDSGHELRYVEHNALKYIVPYFEEIATQAHFGKKINQPWRAADLLSIRNNGNNLIPYSKKEEKEKIKVISYSLPNRAFQFRVFIKMVSKQLGVLIKKEETFTSSISRRDSVPDVNLWTSEKDGYHVEDPKFVVKVLEEWSKGNTIDDSIRNLSKELDVDLVIVGNKVNAIESLLHLWSEHTEGVVRRSDKDILEANQKLYSSWATKASKREYNTKPDGFRIEYKRDRDRIIWSSSFRKLSAKTQLFPLGADDFLRQRLTHSIEVMQLATTIASSFGLDEDLVEASALAHDIGHTPFGHSGENALDKLIKKLGYKCGFNHYEHGVDIVRYLDGSYNKNMISGHPGIDLTPEVCNSIIKHTYTHSGKGLSYENIRSYSKHNKFIEDGYCHLEGQAVRAADKISYLISDIEDGIKLGSVKLADILSCRLFYRNPIDFRILNGESLYLKFIEQRSSIIKLLMEDVIIESSKRISKNKSSQDIIKQSHYCISQSAQIQEDMDEVWEKIQVKKLHNDPRVLAINMKASRMVSELTLLFILYPELIEESFRHEHKKICDSEYMDFYKNYKKTFDLPKELTRFLPFDLMIGFSEKDYNDIETEKLILAKDYVASLSDNATNAIYAKLIQK